jgi:hypothetical protein
MTDTDRDPDRWVPMDHHLIQLVIAGLLAYWSIVAG